MHLQIYAYIGYIYVYWIGYMMGTCLQIKIPLTIDGSLKPMWSNCGTGGVVAVVVVWYQSFHSLPRLPLYLSLTPFCSLSLSLSLFACLASLETHFKALQESFAKMNTTKAGTGDRRPTNLISHLNVMISYEYITLYSMDAFSFTFTCFLLWDSFGFYHLICICS